MLSILIPSRVPDYLQKTIDDLLANATGEVEIIVILDGYWPDPMVRDHPKVKVIHQGIENQSFGMRAAINAGARLATGLWLMKADEHCMFDRGFDSKLAAVCDSHSLVVPRRLRFDPAKWLISHDPRPPVDHMFLSRQHGYLHGWRWDERTVAHENIPVEDTMTIQGSCWFMPTDLWHETVGPLDEANYGPFANEAQEVSLKVWMSGGSCVVNKNTWYAHYHKPEKGGGYRFTREQWAEHKAMIEKGRKFCTDFWMNNRWEKRKRDLGWLVEKFKPVPSWHRAFAG